MQTSANSESFLADCALATIPTVPVIMPALGPSPKGMLAGSRGWAIKTDTGTVLSTCHYHTSLLGLLSVSKDGHNMLFLTHPSQEEVRRRRR